jgi:hypothetical protein
MSDPIPDIGALPEHLLWLDYDGEDRALARRVSVLALLSTAPFETVEDFISAFVTADDYVANGLENIQSPPATVTTIRGGKE